MNREEDLRRYERANDRTVIPGLWTVARLDGRGFTRLTKTENEFEKPFDPRFRDAMIATVEHLFGAGFCVQLAYSQSDEISLFFDRWDDAFARTARKWNSVLAGEASAAFTKAIGRVGAFDCRLCEMPDANTALRYFRWRYEDAHRNALSAHCYWMLRGEGLSAGSATRQLSGKGTAEKNELLFERGVNFNDLPAWQKRGFGAWWETYTKQGHNPVTDETVEVERKRLRVDLELGLGDDFDAWVGERLV